MLAVPTDKILSIYTQWQKPEDLNPLRLKTIAHFFEHYKDLEPGKWVKILGWEGPGSRQAGNPGRHCQLQQGPPGLNGPEGRSGASGPSVCSRSISMVMACAARVG